MALPRIIYDATCAICTNFQHMIKAKVKDRAEYYPSESGAKDFKYIDAAGNSYVGTDAVDRMATDFPEITDYLMILPEKYRKAGLKAIYKAAKPVRKVIGVVKRGGCNCGKH
jgi:predicted DCC family thiol-disulfide oxidoreductase YuxK